MVDLNIKDGVLLNIIFVNINNEDNIIFCYVNDLFLENDCLK